MAEEESFVSKPGFTVSKVVSTPTSLSWSQTYNAGNLFAVLSLTKSEENNEDLNSLGKEIFNNLEAEYFSLESKDLESIKNAILIVSDKIPEVLSCSFIVAVVFENILYLFSKGLGKILLKRQGKTGVVLNGTKDGEEKINTASGFLENDDIFVLETEAFESIISKNELFASLETTPSEATEILSPKVHEKEEGGASIIIVKFQKQEEIIEEALEKEDLIAPTTQEILKESNKKLVPLSLSLAIISRYLKLPKINLSHSKKFFLTIAFILGVVLISTIFFAVKKQEDTSSKALFNQIFPKAQKKYDEGLAVLTLNKNLAGEDLLYSQKILNENKDKFKPESQESKKIAELLKKVNDSLSSLSNASFSDAKLVDNTKSELLDYESKSINEFPFSQDNKNLYFAAEKGIYSIDKSSNEKKQIIKYNQQWSDATAIGVYSGNVYILDKKSSAIFKFTAVEDGFEKTDYLKDKIDLSNSKSMAIDGSVYILFKDGNILKFTKGKQESFKVSGLDKPLSSPTKIFTDKETDKVYILDIGNSRIVALGKDGAFKEQILSNIIETARDFEVLEKEKRIYILSQNKVYEFGLK